MEGRNQTPVQWGETPLYCEQVTPCGSTFFKHWKQLTLNICMLSTVVSHRVQYKDMAFIHSYLHKAFATSHTPAAIFNLPVALLSQNKRS